MGDTAFIPSPSGIGRMPGRHNKARSSESKDGVALWERVHVPDEILN